MAVAGSKRGAGRHSLRQQAEAARPQSIEELGCRRSGEDTHVAVAGGWFDSVVPAGRLSCSLTLIHLVGGGLFPVCTLMHGDSYECGGLGPAGGICVDGAPPQPCCWCCMPFEGQWPRPGR